jgi:hypothetical protein
MSDEVTPSPIEVSEADLLDLRQRLERSRWPGPETVEDRSVAGYPFACRHGPCPASATRGLRERRVWFRMKGHLTRSISPG